MDKQIRATVYGDGKPYGITFRESETDAKRKKFGNKGFRLKLSTDDDPAIDDIDLDEGLVVRPLVVIPDEEEEPTNRSVRFKQKIRLNKRKRDVGDADGRHGKWKAIVCITTEMYFDSTKDAAAEYDFSQGNLSTHLIRPHERPSVNGMVFRRARPEEVKAKRYIETAPEPA